jgi:hypothetical protein
MTKSLRAAWAPVPPTGGRYPRPMISWIFVATIARLFPRQWISSWSTLGRQPVHPLHRLPTIGYVAEMVPFGILLSYGQDIPDYFRRAVTHTDKILKGAKPAALSVEQPTRFKPESAGTEQNRMNKTRSNPLTSAAI